MLKMNKGKASERLQKNTKSGWKKEDGYKLKCSRGLAILSRMFHNFLCKWSRLDKEEIVLHKVHTATVDAIKNGLIQSHALLCRGCDQASVISDYRTVYILFNIHERVIALAVYFGTTPPPWLVTFITLFSSFTSCRLKCKVGKIFIPNVTSVKYLYHSP